MKNDMVLKIPENKRSIVLKEMGNREKKRNGEIDVLRFIFALSIVGRHFSGSYKFGIFTTPAIGVEFFFLVSGYLMTKSADRIVNQGGKQEIGQSTWYYIIRKGKAFFPYYICAFFFQIILALLIERQSLMQIYDNIIRSIPTITLSFMGLTVSDK